MTVGAVSRQLRRRVADRARHRCEYCGVPEQFAAYRHEPDHIVPRQHGGRTELSNLALACLRCNRRKGPNVASFDPDTGELTPLFSPRTHRWPEHFRFVGVTIQPLSAIGRVTVAVLALNDPDRLVERELLHDAGIELAEG